MAAGFTGKWDPFGSAFANLAAGFRQAIRVHRSGATVGGTADLLIEGTGGSTCRRLSIGGPWNVRRPLVSRFHGQPGCPGRGETADSRAGRRWERLYSRWDYRDFLARGCADIQPDVSHARGLMEIKKIAAMAECHHIPLCPHNPSGPVANAATLQLAACVPNFYVLETMSSDVPYRQQISTEEVRFEAGLMQIPDKPGLGIDLSEEAMAQYPYRPRGLRHYRGTLTEIRPDDAQGYFGSGSGAAG